MNTGKYFYIKCKNSNFVFDVSGASAAPNTPVILFHKKTQGAENQLWYYNAVRRAFYSKIGAGAFCLDVNDNGDMVINYYNGDDTQKWMMKGDNIVRVSYQNKAIDVYGAKYEPHNRLIQWDYHNNGNQQFVLEPQSPLLFYIKNAGTNQVMDVEGANRSPGAKCCVWNQKPSYDASNQLFYEDQFGYIRSNFTHFSLESHGGGVKFSPFDHGNWHQRWCFHDNHIVNADRPSRVLTASSGLRVDNLQEGRREQLWILEYI